jgi:hypothetical protein
VGEANFFYNKEVLMKNIVIGSLVRNRGWSLPQFLNCLQNSNYPLENLAFHFILNDSHDESKLILRKFKADNKNKYRYIRLSEVYLGTTEDITLSSGARQGHIRPHIYPSLAVLRNLLLDSAFLDDKCDYLFAVDSDILVEGETLNLLLAKNSDFTAGIVVNGTNPHGRIFNFLDADTDGTYFRNTESDEQRVAKGQPFPVSVTGAVYLLSRKVLANHHCRYIPNSLPEDFSFCAECRKQGIIPCIEPKAFCNHLL